ncbi:MAG: hypothetical protein JNM63_03000, partial [Spirochaetia bacterium]|nr:hypothetical protein [Spirochaetia bacterium]
EMIDLQNGQTRSLTPVDGSLEIDFAPAGSLLLRTGPALAGSKKSAFHPGAGVSFPLPEIKETLDLKKLRCELEEPNVLLLNEVILEMNGKEVHRGPVSQVWHRHFYPAPEGTPFRASYTFHSEVELAGAFLAIEAAENLDRISFNGKPALALFKKGSPEIFDSRLFWKDLAFRRVPIPKIKKGLNRLVLEGKKINNITGVGFHRRVPDWKTHQPTEVEEIYLVGNFSLKKIGEGNYGIAAFKAPNPGDLVGSGFPFYSGWMKVASEFRKPAGAKRLFLELDGSFAAAKVSINGKTLDSLLWPPYRLEITQLAKTGNNLIEIRSATTLVNLLGPNRTYGIKKIVYVGPHAFVTRELFQKEYTFFDFGISGLRILTTD